jgi:hypothetical protein
MMNNCVTCVYFDGNRDAGRMEPGRCLSLDSMRGGHIVRAYERCANHYAAELEARDDG